MEKIKEELELDLEKITSIKELTELKVKYFGKKGIITDLQSKIKDIPNEEKKAYGMKVNEIKGFITERIENLESELKEKELAIKLENESIDITLPSKKVKTGSKNVMKRIQEEFEDRVYVSVKFKI